MHTHHVSIEGLLAVAWGAESSSLRFPFGKKL
jgi:hypothetical protein